MADAQALANEAVNEAMNQAGQAAQEAAQQALDAANITADAAMDSLNEMGNVFSGMCQGFSSAWSSLTGSGKNYCNARIENMRNLGTAHESKEKVDFLWQRLNEVRVATLQTDAILGEWWDVLIGASKARKGDALWNLSNEWNDFAYQVMRPDLYVQHIPTYHKKGADWVDQRADAEQETYDLNRGFGDFILRDILKKYMFKARAGKNTQDYIGLIKYFAEHRNFAGSADYPGFRCEKMAIVQRALDAMSNMGIPIRTFNTDHFNNTELTSWLNQVSVKANEINTTNEWAKRQTQAVRLLYIQRNLQFVSDIYLAKMDVLNRMKAVVENATNPDQEHIDLIAEAENRINRFYQKALKVAQLEGNQDTWNRLANLQARAIAGLNAVMLKEFNQDLERLNQEWSSTTEMPTIVLPYAKKCLHSFFRYQDSANPLYVRDCNEEMQKVLNDISSGIARSPASGAAILRRVSINAVTGERYEKHDLRYQFRLWNAETPGAVRLSTAVSEGHPNTDYCLGVPMPLAPSDEASRVRTMPCEDNTRTQLWEKMPDEGGEAFFRLKSLETGLCATWNGAVGVDSLVLDNCNEANKEKQVMTAGWPIKGATHAQARLRTQTGPKQYAFKNANNMRCIKINGDQQDVIAVRGVMNTHCGYIQNHRNVNAAFKFTIEHVGTDNRRIVYGQGEDRRCLIATDMNVDFWTGEVLSDANSNRPKGRLIALGDCDGENSLWQFGPPGWGGWHEKRYSIREAYGKRQCMERYISLYEDIHKTKQQPLMLRDCGREPLSQLRPDVTVRKEYQTFIPYVVQ